MRAPLRVLIMVALLAACTAASPAAPPARHLFGLKWNSYDTPTRYGEAISAYSGGSSFHDIVWCAVERTPGRQDWNLEDRAVDNILGRGYEVLIRIRIGSCWASGRPASGRARIAASHPPADLARYERFVGGLVARYARKGVHLYAVENEIDAATSWAAAPAAYRAVAMAGTRAIRRADPGARVADPGLSSSTYGVAVARARLAQGRPGEALAVYRDFYRRRPNSRYPAAADAAGLRRALAAPAAQRALAAHGTVFELDRAHVFDTYQLHYYDHWSLAAAVVDYVRGAGLPVEAWEVGSFWPDGYDPAAHGVETAKLITELLAGGVRRLVYLPLYHSPGAIARTETWRALHDADGRPRPARTVLDAFRTYASGPWKTPGSGSWKRLTGLRGGTSVQAGRTVLVTWSDTGGTLPAPPKGGATVITLPGGSSRPWRSGPLALTSAPVIVVAPGLT
ncbi:hypothetical protein [Nonomuraea endophytica]|uniref:hypothetical protein n=1 Tax=Nonomuraea endophytica TaxID=714136 RepID=UPI0037C8FF61